MNIKLSLKTALCALVTLAGAALCFTLATLALSEVSYTRFGQALLVAAIATGLVRLIQRAGRPQADHIKAETQL